MSPVIRHQRLSRRVLRVGVVICLMVGQFIGAVGFPIFSNEVARTALCGCPEELHQQHACCCQTPAPAAKLPACCAKKAIKSCCASSESATAVASESLKTKVRWVAGFMAQRCRGELPQGSTPTEPLQSPASEVVFSVIVEANDELSITSDSLPPSSSIPPDPPPRLG